MKPLPKRFIYADENEFIVISKTKKSQTNIDESEQKNNDDANET